MNSLSTKYIQYDISTRWNSTFRMLDDGLKARRQVEAFLDLQTEIPEFTNDDWDYLDQLHQVLAKFDELTSFVSERKAHITMALPVYYELHDLLTDASLCQGVFGELRPDIALAATRGLQKYEKYYSLMDDNDLCYTAAVLDPRIKGDIILGEVADREEGKSIIQTIRENFANWYPQRNYSEQVLQSRPPGSSTSTCSALESRVFRRLPPVEASHPIQLVSDIDRYFDSPRVSADGTGGADWLLDWWYRHRHEFPQMATAARDFLAIPASEVAVERLFSRGRDLLGIRRHSMSAETMRMLVLLGDADY